MSPKRVVYSALIAEYEEILDQPVAQESNLDFILFTDNKNLTSDTWEIYHVDAYFPEDPVRSARYIKTIGMEYLSSYDEIMWIDNTVQLNHDPEYLFDFHLRDFELAFPVHSYRKDLLAEFAAVLDHNLESKEVVNQQLANYRNKMPDELRKPAIWTGINFRKNKPNVRKFMQNWFFQIVQYSKRDQLSINWSIKTEDLKTNLFELDAFESEFHKWPIHQNRTPSQNHPLDGVVLINDSELLELGKLHNEISELKSKLLLCEKNFENAKNDIFILNQQIHLISNSKSWKVTKPLRFLSFLLKNKI